MSKGNKILLGLGIGYFIMTVLIVFNIVHLEPNIFNTLSIAALFFTLAHFFDNGFNILLCNMYSVLLKYSRNSIQKSMNKIHEKNLKPCIRNYKFCNFCIILSKFLVKLIRRTISSIQNANRSLFYLFAGIFIIIGMIFPSTEFFIKLSEAIPILIFAIVLISISFEDHKTHYLEQIESDVNETDVYIVTITVYFDNQCSECNTNLSLKPE